MSDERADRMHAYWEKNIGEFGRVYSDMSGERFDAPWWMNTLYRRLIMPIERRMMKHRYALTMDFIQARVHEGMVAADIGCGTGIFTVAMLRRGAQVKAIDYSQTALRLTRRLVEQSEPQLANQVEYVHADVTETRLPESDLAIAMGVTPYLVSLDRSYDHILPTTKSFFCLLLDPHHWANRLRAAFPALNVRHVRCFDPAHVDSLLARYGFRLVSRVPFATGYLDFATRGQPAEEPAGR